MRSTYLWLGLLAACGGGNDVDPRVIAGGGISDGEIDGEVNVTVVDQDDEPIADATVEVGGVEATTDDAGVATFAEVSGRQTVTVRADGFRPAVWVGVNGANVTIPLTSLDPADIPQATLSGSIAGWDTVQPLDPGHAKAAFVLYSQTDALGDDANNLPTPNMGNICGVIGDVCNWQLTARAGDSVTVVAAVVNIDPQGPGSDDDVVTIMGWATRNSITVEDGVNQQGLVLDLVEAGNLEDVSVDFGAPPSGLIENAAIVGIELGADEVIQLPLFLAGEGDAVPVPQPSVFGGSAYRLTAVAQSSSGDLGAQSILIQRGETGPALVAGDWLIPPTGVTADLDGASWEPVDGAAIHQIQYRDDLGDNVLEITVFDDSTEVVVPSLVRLLDGGATQARVSGIGATLDVTDFSLDEDRDQLFGIAAEPVDL
jgi:hypothetical protein